MMGGWVAVAEELEAAWCVWVAFDLDVEWVVVEVSIRRSLSGSTAMDVSTFSPVDGIQPMVILNIELL